MHRSGPLSYADGRAIITSYDLRRSVQCLSLHLSQRIVAVGVHGDIKIVKIDPFTCSVSEITTLSHSQQQVQVNDLSWCPHENAQHRLAVCYTNGEIKVLAFHDKSAMSSLSSSSISSSGITGGGNPTSSSSNMPSPSVASSQSSNAQFMMSYGSKTPGQSPLHPEWFADRVDNSGESKSATRVCWHPNELFTLYTAHTDGCVKQFHTGSSPSNNKAIRVFRARQRTPIRDIKFNPFNTDIFADCTDGGSLRIWDRKADTKQPMMMIMLAHKGRINALAWCPYRDSVIATGSCDKTVKVWDTSKCTLPYASSTGGGGIGSSLSQFSFSTSGQTGGIGGGNAASGFGGTSSSSTTTTNANDGKDVAEPELMCTINTQAEVPRILWGLADDNSAYIVSLFYEAAPNQQGIISFWSEDRDKRNVPVCVLKGHSTESVTAFDWIEISSYFDSLPEQRPSRDHLDNRSSGNSSYISSSSSSSGRTSIGSSNASNSNYARGGRANHHRLSITSASSTTGGGSTTDSASGRNASPSQQQTLFKCIISTSRDGKLLIQNPRYGYMPYNHMTTTVTALSNQGHCAYQRGTMKRVKELHFPSNQQQAEAMSNSLSLSLDTSANETREAIDPSLSPMFASNGGGGSGSGFGGSSSIVANNNRNYDRDENNDRDGDNGTGRIMIGLADFKDLREARGIRSIRGGVAEASVFDPALIYLLARNYSLAYAGAARKTPSMNNSSQSPSSTELQDIAEETPQQVEEAVNDDSAHERSRVHSQSMDGILLLSAVERADIERKKAYAAAMDACRHNFNVAAEAGLRCRASVWASVMTLLPEPTMAATMETTTSNTACPLLGELPFSKAVLADLLVELLDGGDAQHFVVVSEVLRRVSLVHDIYTLADISAVSARRIYLAYIDLLKKQQLFCEANEIIKASDDDYIASLSKREVEVQVKCGFCRKDVPKKLAEGASGVVWCQVCKRSASNCALCQQPVTGLLQWCPICSHGGHLSCMQKWFRLYSCCPTGCCHDCCFTSSIHDLRSDEEKEKQGFAIRDGVEESLKMRRKGVRKNRKRQLGALVRMLS